jgi:hypothetical protein
VKGLFAAEGRDRVAPGREERIASAEARLAALAADYPSLAQEALEELRAAWAGFRARPDFGAALPALLLPLHTLRGEGATFDYPLVTTIGASLAMVLESGLPRDPRAWPAVEAHLAALEAVLLARLSGDGGEIGQQVMMALRDRVAEATAAIRLPRTG